MASERYIRNSITKLVLPDGSEAVSHSDKERIIFDSFNSRLGTSNSPPMLFDLDSLIQPTPGLEDLSSHYRNLSIAGKYHV